MLVDDLLTINHSFVSSSVELADIPEETPEEPPEEVVAVQTEIVPPEPVAPPESMAMRKKAPPKKEPQKRNATPPIKKPLERVPVPEKKPDPVPPPPPKEPPKEAPIEPPKPETKKEEDQPGSRLGEKLKSQEPETEVFVATDQAGLKLRSSAGALSDRTTFSTRNTIRKNSVKRALGDGTGDSDRILVNATRKGTRDTTSGLKAGKTLEALGRPTPQSPSQIADPVPEEGRPPDSVRLPEVAPLAGEPVEGTGVGLQLKVETPLRASKALPTHIRRRKKAAPTPEVTPVPETPPAPPPPPTDVPPKLDYFDKDGFWQPVGMDVPRVLEDPRPEAAAAENTVGWSGLEILDSDAENGDRTELSLHEGPIGVWMVEVDDHIRRHWTYPPELAALGYTGRVVIDFYVMPNGVVTNIEVVSADPIDLTASALAAIPLRTAPLPRESRYAKGFRVRYVFRYQKAAK